MSTILTITDNRPLQTAINDFSTKRGHMALFVVATEKGLELHRQQGVDLVIVALPLRKGDSVELLQQLRVQDPRTAILVCGRDDSIKGAFDAMELGAVEYLSDPLQDNDALQAAIGVSLGVRQSDIQLRYLRKKDAAETDWQTIIGKSEAMREVFVAVRRICHRTIGGGSTPKILITGETGTGKGLIAKAIHYNSARRSRAFVEVNCAAIPATLIEAELFGYERGAFTDAKTRRAGLFETANGGTLFLDEIGALPLELQSRLLTVLEEDHLRRIGGNQSIPINVQVIAATHRNLEAMVKNGSFRADLFHRLNVLHIELPPLRKRDSDVVLLAQHLITSMCLQYGIPVKKLPTTTMSALVEYPWPGNVRELRNQIERIVLLVRGQNIEPTHFDFRDVGAPATVDTVAAGPTIAIEKQGGELRVNLPAEGFSLEALEKQIISQALKQCDGNVSKTARYLQISRQTLIYRLKKFDIPTE